MAVRKSGMLSALLAVAASVLVACGGDVPPAPISVAPPPPAVASTVVTFSVLDSNAGNLLTGATTTLTFGGTGASSLRNLDGNAVTSVTTTNGIAQVQLATGTAPSATAPLSFTVTAARSGNITVTEPVRLVSTSASNVDIRMLPLQTTAGAVTNLPAAAAAGNVTTASATTAGSLPANSGGNFVAAATLPATATQTAAVQATVAVPPTVTAFVNGTTTPAAVGTVAAQIVVVDPKATTAAAILPPTVVNAPASGTAPATVDTVANVAKIVLTDSAGNAINRFSSPIILSLDIPATVLNPATGAAFALNETMPISTYNEASGTWVRKTLLNGTAINGTVTAIDAATGNRKVSFQTDSLSWFAVMVPTAACNSTQFSLTPAASSTVERRVELCALLDATHLGDEAQRRVCRLEVGSRLRDLFLLVIDGRAGSDLHDGHIGRLTAGGRARGGRAGRRRAGRRRCAGGSARRRGRRSRRLGSRVLLARRGRQHEGHQPRKKGTVVHSSRFPQLQDAARRRFSSRRARCSREAARPRAPAEAVSVSAVAVGSR